MIARRWLAAAAMVSLSGGAFSTGKGATPPSPAVTPAPNASTAQSWWVAAGCNALGNFRDPSGDQRYMLSCPGALEGAKTAACTSLVTAPKAIEALSPGALLECHGPSGGRMAADAGIRWEGCLFGYWTSYVQYAHGTFRFLRSWEAFKQTFAPVDTPAQALAFAVALTGAFPLYSMVPPKNYKLVGSDVQPSYARAQSGDFRVRLFSVHHCVMQPSWEAIEYRVTSEGDVDVLSRKDIFAPKSGPANQCCVD